MWMIEVDILQRSHASENSESSYKIEVDEFKILDIDFAKLKIKKNNEKVSEWFSQFRDKIN